MKILQNSEIPKDKWDDLLEKGLFASPFQTKEYFDLINTINGSHAIVFALIDNDTIKAIMVVTVMKESRISGFFSRRGIIFGGPVINQVTKEELSFFLIEIENRLRKQVIYLETRNFFDFCEYADSFYQSKWCFKPYLNVKLNLSGIRKEELSKLFKYNRRREIKQSILNGATYHTCNDEKELLGVYKILEDLYQRVVKIPLPTFDFFQALFKSSIFQAFVVMHDNHIIGGAFCLILPNKGLYTFYYCGQRDYHHRIFPTHLAVLAALEYSIENNIAIVDFMGAGKPNVDYGVRKYKLEFGGELVEHGRFLKVLNPWLYNIGVLGFKLKKLIR